MTRRSAFLSDDVSDYLAHLTPEPELLQQLRVETAGLRGAGMQIGVEQGRFMSVLVELLGARRTIEVGVYTGYSSICTALSLPEDGLLIACDRSEEWTDVAQRFWKEAGVEHKIQLRLGPAEQTLKQLISEHAPGSFDFAFIDADKEGYAQYYELCLQLLRPGGLIVFDNALWDGKVAQEQEMDADTVALRELNRKVLSDERVSASLIPVGDGLLLARKRG